MAKEKTGRIGWKRVRWADSALAADGRTVSDRVNIRTVDRGYSCPANALLLGRVLRISLCTAAAPLSAGRMHQSRYCGPDLCCCSSAAVACSIALLSEWLDVDLAGMWPRGTREGNGRGPAATTAMWPAVLTGGRPTGRRAATRRFDPDVMPERSGGKSLAKAAGHRQVADKQEAAGGCGSRRSHGQLPERRQGELQGT